MALGGGDPDDAVADAGDQGGVASQDADLAALRGEDDRGRLALEEDGVGGQDGDEHDRPPHAMA